LHVAVFFITVDAEGEQYTLVAKLDDGKLVYCRKSGVLPFFYKERYKLLVRW